MTTIIAAAKAGDLEAVRRLAPVADDGDCTQALMEACQEGHLPVVQLLLQHGVDHHAGEEDAFRWACRNGHLPVVQLLLDLGVHHQARDEEAFGRACRNGHLPVVQLLLDLGVSDRAVAQMLEDSSPVTDLLQDYIRGRRTKSARLARS